MQFKIGNLIINNQVCLAPMAGISNSAFRRIVKEMGCGLVFAEMVSDKAIVYNNEKTKRMLYFTESERPIAQQIFGSDKESFVEAAKIIYQEMKPDIIDINMGCPVPKVALRAQAGASLLKDPTKIHDIVSAVVEAVPCPVTVKIRSGWDANNINAVEVAKTCENAGASAITVHARTRAQGYSGAADWRVIKLVKDSVSIPVIGNGDIKKPQDAKRMIDETGCDAIMIGRGVLGNPWLIKDAVRILKGENFDEQVDNKSRIYMAIKHLDYLSEIKPDKQAVLEMRGHIAWYLKGIPRSAEVKEQVYKTTSLSELKKLLYIYLEELEKDE
jgi:nifR3 family TIM-barrel protein